MRHRLMVRMVLFFGLTFWLGAAGRAAAGDPSLVPAGLQDPQRQNLQKFLASVPRPAEFLPAGARLSGITREEIVGARGGVPVAEYLTIILPERAFGLDQAPRRAEVYWFRPNPTRGKPGLTVMRVVDLNTGRQIGEDEFLFNHTAPLSREEFEQARQLAREKSAEVKALYDRYAAKEIQVDSLPQLVTLPDSSGNRLGDRVTHLLFWQPGSTTFVSVTVNVTQQTVHDPNAR